MLRPWGEKGGLPLGSRIVLQGEYGIWRRHELRAELERAQLGGSISIDMSGVTLMDAGSVWLLIHLHHRLQEHTPGANVILLNAPRVVKRVIELVGASALFVFSTKR